MGEHGIYEKLADYLDSMPIGAPKTPELFEILKTLYTEEEAELAVKLPFLPMTLDALADRTGMEEAKLEPMLKGMLKKGLIFEELGADEPLYRLLPTVVGFSETPFWAGKKTAEAETLAPLWLKYVRSAFYHEVGGKSDTPMTRVIPMQESIDDDRKVAPYEKLAEKVKETSYQAVAHCPCRLMRRYAGEETCEHSTENCLHFGSLGKYIVAHGMGREITVDETLDILKKSNEEGLVHVTGNYQEEIETICNCCADACIFITGLMQQGEEFMFARSNYVSEIDQESCAECGTCAERCPVDAIVQDDGPAEVDAAKCIGCGVCYPTCPSESISLVSRPESEQLPVLLRGELVTKVMSDKGREFQF
jgi:NAD-dependent dihydropyrimidine dehydrogenase PreA subunit